MNLNSVSGSLKLFDKSEGIGSKFSEIFQQDVNLRKQCLEFLQFWWNYLNSNGILRAMGRGWRPPRAQRERERERETRNPGQPTPATHPGKKYAVRDSPHSDKMSLLFRRCTGACCNNMSFAGFQDTEKCQTSKTSKEIKEHT